MDCRNMSCLKLWFRSKGGMDIVLKGGDIVEIDLLERSSGVD